MLLRNHCAMSHDHSHSHAGAAGVRPLAIVLTLTATVFAAELVGAWWTSSLALAADAGHMFVDSMGLVIALVAAVLSRRPRSDEYTWGFVRVEAVSAAFQAGILMVVCVWVAYEAITRFFEPAHVLAPQMAVFGVVGLLANAVGLVILLSHRDQSLNLQAAFLEVLNDALGSIAVLVAAGVIYWTGWAAADPIASLIIACLMGPRAARMFVRAVNVLLEKTPEGLDLQQVREHMMRIEHVIDVHDMHGSTVSTGLVALTAHVTVDPRCYRDGCGPDVLHKLQDCLAEHFPVAVEHCTFQLDTPTHRDHETLTHHT